MRLWKVIDGVPYMINDPRLGILALNPKRGKKKMAKRRGHSARHMAWVRSFQKRRRKSNYVMAGPVVGLNPKRRRRGRKSYRKSNPGRARAFARGARGFLGLPPVMPIVYGVGGFVAVAGLQGVVQGFLPAEWVTDASGKENMLAKYGVLIVSLIGTTYLAKMVLGPGGAALAGIGGGIYIATQAAHDFLPGVIPGMHQYAPIGGYTQIRAYRQIRQYAPIGQIAAPDFGAQNTAASAGNGGANIVQARFRRFQ